jgi:hypothetical protein
MGIWYATRERVSDSLEANDSVASSRQIDRRLEASSRAVESILKRRFYPERKTIYIDYPNFQYAYPWRLWLEGNEIISLETLTAGGISISPSNVMLRRGDDIDEPPYDSLELDQSSAAVFQSGQTDQRALAVTGLFSSDKDTDTSIPTALLGAGINASVTTLVLNPATGIYNVGVGSIVLIGTERVITTERRMSDTGVNTAGTLDDLQNAELLATGDGAAFAPGEIILVDAERMRINDIAGNNLIVDRAWDGTTLADHASGVDIYSARTFTVKRGALGTTAAAHSLNDNTYSHEVPGLVEELTVAIATVLLQQNAAAYTAEMGTGQGKTDTPGVGLPSLIAAAKEAYGRVSRSDAI